MQHCYPEWKNQGFVQQKVETSNEDFSQNFSSDGDRRKKMEKIKKIINSRKVYAEFRDETNIDDLITKRLTLQTLRLVDEEFSKDISSRNYSLLEDILKKLPFFNKFPPEIRAKLLRCSVFKQYSQNDIIIRQGEIGDSMFVILSGSIKIVKASAEFGGLEVAINSMYDGETFGELALLSEGIDENIKRSATCMAQEDSKLLAISKDDYKAILLYEMQNDIMAKVSFFKSMPFFQSCSEISLIPLASNIEFVRYKIDDRIIEAGEKPKGLYMIFKGRCNLYWEGFVAKSEQPSSNSNVKIRPKTPKPYYTGKIVPRNPGPSKRNLDKRCRQSFDLSLVEVEKAKPYLPANLTGKYVSKERILCKPLKESDYFGGRALLEGLVDANRHDEGSQNVTFEFMVAKPAKFTVVAESMEVRIFIMNRRHFPLLSEEILVRSM